VALIGGASLALAAAAWTVEASTSSRVIAGAAAACDLVFIAAAFRFTRMGGLRRSLPGDQRADLAARAAQGARLG
jgi:hypothetical protein